MTRDGSLILYTIFGLIIFAQCLSEDDPEVLQRSARFVDLSAHPPPELTEADFLVPTKKFCEPQGSPVALGALAGVRRKKGESRDDALKRAGKAGQEDQSIFNPKKQMLRFNKKYGRTRDLLFFQNDGQTFRFLFRENYTSDASVRGENWDDEYMFAYGQFQWAGEFSHKTGGWGAGHSVNSFTFPAELEMIHYRRSDGTMAEAVKNNGVLIISTLLRLMAEGVPALTPLLGNAAFVSQPGPMKLLHAPVNFRQLFPLGDGYFEYMGANTFPPCNGNVKRIVFETPIEVDESQLFNLQFLVYTDKTTMINNFTPVQKLDGRNVTYYSEGFKFTKLRRLPKKEEVPKSKHEHWKLG